MTAPRRVADVLTAVALAIGALGAALWLWPVTVDVAPLAPVLASPPPATRTTATDDPALAARVVAANPFSPTRTAPRTRWVPPDALGPMADVTVSQQPPGLLPDPTIDLPAGATDAAPTPATRDEVAQARDRRVPALFGTVIGADGPRALLRLDARIPGAQLYAEGARAGGWRVQRVEADRVTLVGRGRTLTLRMPRAAPPLPVAP